MVVGVADGNPEQIHGEYKDIERSAMKEKDPWTQGLAISNLSTFSWSDHYSANPPPYTQGP